MTVPDGNKDRTVLHPVSVIHPFGPVIIGHDQGDHEDPGENYCKIKNPDNIVIGVS